MSEKKRVTLGEIKNTKAASLKNEISPYFRSSFFDDIEITFGDDVVVLEKSSPLFINEDDVVLSANVLGVELKNKEKTMVVLNLVNRQSDGGRYLKVCADRLEVINNGVRIRFEKGDILNLESKEDRLENLAYYLENGHITEDVYKERVAKVEKTPEFVLANVVGKGTVV